MISLLNRKNRRRNIEKAAQRGMTLIEIMIVIIIMAMIATGVSIGVMKKMEESQEKDARLGACTIRQAVILYLAENPGDCPSMETLRAEEAIDTEMRTTDPWDNDYVIECGDRIKVYSTGKEGNEELTCNKKKNKD